MQAIHPGPYRKYGAAMRVPTMPHSARRPSAAVIRRRRLVAMFFIVSFAFLAWSGLRQLADTSGGGPLTVAGRSAQAQLITRSETIVQPGDTLWSIARRVQPTGDVRPLVSQLIDQYGGHALQVGETIEIP